MKIEHHVFDFHGGEVESIAMTDLKLDALYVVYPGIHRYPIGERVEAVPLWALMPSQPEGAM